MHRGVGLTAFFLALALALPLAAQQQQASSFMTGVQPSDLHFQKINADRGALAFSHSPVIQPPTVNKIFSPRALLLPNLNWLPRITWSKAPPPPPKHRKKRQPAG